ncbi:hypothetical protein GF314_10560 [bacterium]|nr:hypothetical protein [bacterium]
MTPDAAMSLGPAVSHQLLHLAVAVVSAMLGAWLLVLAVALWRRRSRGERAEPYGGPERPPSRQSVPTGALVPVLVILPTAATLRQLWPHPGLRWPALVVLVASLLLAAAGHWLARREVDP